MYSFDIFFGITLEAQSLGNTGIAFSAPGLLLTLASASVSTLKYKQSLTKYKSPLELKVISIYFSQTRHFQ